MKIKVLVNAYAICPNLGSEPGMGWNWCIHLAKYCELHIINEGEFKKEIEAALNDVEYRHNLHFYYVPVSNKVRKMCWNQGDWRFYAHYKNWQYEAFKLAAKIVKKENIQVLHQLNMIGFREPGYLWKINEIPFVWGPIGGLKLFPKAYLKEAGAKIRIFNQLKNWITIVQLKFDKRVNAALKRSSALISSIPDSYRAIKKYKSLESILIPETGCYLSEDLPLSRFDNKFLDVMWVGKFDFRKQLPIAIQSIAACKNERIRLHVYGKGNTSQEENAKQLVAKLGIGDQVMFWGSQPNERVLKAMKEAQLFFFTSVSEDTSTVVLEAIGNRLPVLCFDTNGFGAIVDHQIGRKIPLSTPQESINHFANELIFLEENRDVLKVLSSNCGQRQVELSWEQKAEKVISIYQSVLKS